MNLLRRLHPQGPPIEELPSPPGPPPVIVLDASLVKAAIKKCANGAGPSPSGWTGDLLVALAADKSCSDAIEVLVEDLVNARLGPDISKLLRLSLLSALRKDGTHVPRPVANGEIFTKLASMYLILHVGKGPILDALPSIQFSLREGGSELAVHLIQSWIDSAREPSLLISADASNAFNDRDRAQILEALFACEDLKPFFLYASWLYGVPSLLLYRMASGAFEVLASSNGVRQGCVLASLLYCLSMQRTYTASVASRPVRAASITDDFYLFGATQQALAAFDSYEAKLRTDNAGIQLNASKMWAILGCPRWGVPPS